MLIMQIKCIIFRLLLIYVAIVALMLHVYCNCINAIIPETAAVRQLHALWIYTECLEAIIFYQNLMEKIYYIKI